MRVLIEAEESEAPLEESVASRRFFDSSSYLERMVVLGLLFGLMNSAVEV